MSTDIKPTLMTANEFLAIPDDGIDRDLIRGIVVERRQTEMTRRNRRHALAEAVVARVLGNWAHVKSGHVLSGEVGFIFRGDPDTVVGIDVAYISAEHAASQDDSTSMVEGPPVLAVEILSPSDKQEDIHRKIHDYLAFGVQRIWIVDTEIQAATVHRPDAKPQMYNSDQTISNDEVLEGLEMPVSELFGS